MTQKSAQLLKKKNNKLENFVLGAKVSPVGSVWF